MQIQTSAHQPTLTTLFTRLRRTNIQTLTSRAFALAAFLAPLPFAAAQSGGSGPSFQLSRPPSTPPESGSGLTTYGGAHLVDDLQPQFVGYGFDWDSTNGQFLFKKPVFTVTNPLGMDAPMHDLSLDVQSFVDGHNSYDSSSLQVSLSVATVAVKASASLQTGVSNSATSNGIGIGLVERVNWDPKVVDLTNPANYMLTPDAIAVLSEPNPAVRASKWKQEFGQFVAIGYNLESQVGLKVTASSFASQHIAQSLFSFTGSYGSVSGSLDLGQFASEALSREGLGISLIFKGDPPPTIHLPVSYVDIDEPAEKSALVNALHSAAITSKAKAGLFLLPASAFPGAPNVGTFDADGALITDVVIAAREAMKQVNRAYAWSYPASLLQFLTVRPNPAGGTYGGNLNLTRDTLVLKLDDLWTAYKDYLTDGHQVAFYENALVHAKNEVHDAGVALEHAMSDIFSMTTSLPAMSVTLTPNWVSNNACDGQYRSFTAVVDNAAAFTDGSYLGIYDWITHMQLPEATFTLRQDQPCLNIWNVPHYFNDPSHFLSILSNSVYTSGPNAGLRRLEFQFQFYVRTNGPYLRAEVQDDFDRIAIDDANAG